VAEKPEDAVSKLKTVRFLNGKENKSQNSLKWNKATWSSELKLEGDDCKEEEEEKVVPQPISE